MDLDIDELKATNKDAIHQKLEQLEHQKAESDDSTERAFLSYAIIILKEVIKKNDL